MPISSKRIIDTLNNLKTVHDDRWIPDSRRRGAFKGGWTNSINPNRKYSDDILESRITWNNLGYRFGQIFGDISSDDIDYIFDVLAENYRNERSILTKEDENDFKEGRLIQRTTNYYERDRKARNKCLDHYGPICQICSINFEETYGEIGRGYIHVHHTEMISKKGGEYKVDPIKDLVPVCPNCHSMIHIGNQCRSIQEIRELINRAKLFCKNL